MMMSKFRIQSRSATVAALTLAVFLFGGSPANAQQPTTTAGGATPAADQAAAPGAAQPADTTPAPFWELIGGFEADTHGSVYAFFGPSYVRPMRPGFAWTARAFANYLAYEFTGADGTTEVRSPGVNAAVGLRFGDKSFFGINAGPEVKWRRTELTGANGQTVSSSETVVGANVGAEVYANPTSHNNIHGIVNYGTADKYTWARLGFKEQVSNRNWQGPTTTYIGIEGIGQGNSDIRSTQVGGFFEVARVPGNFSLTFRVGYKRSTFDVGPNKTGPYFGVGFYKRLG
jgi:hypothetical protein